ncbi:Methyltransferase type 11 [uncultured Desulfobacterium sp.]|uniref:Methyltransferase type 11 n=1 Tax=uncultured Desulfobacterium sp. TaxID=201089 RepID=A0A445MTN6_9BACT|nr:Methyltransferase type 11 [uncultured Desulfobacterium sp.]
MSHRVCPPWVGYFLLNPLRRLFENPEKILGPFVREGMIVLEPGCGMGYFTLPLASMVGPKGRIVAAEIQEKMLSVLSRRARKAGLLDRIDLRHIGEKGYNFEDLSDQVDMAVAIHMVHEVPDRAVFFKAVWDTLKPGGKMFVLEPKGHVSQMEFEQTMATAKQAGFRPEALSVRDGSRKRLLIK